MVTKIISQNNHSFYSIGLACIGCMYVVVLYPGHGECTGPDSDVLLTEK